MIQRTIYTVVKTGLAAFAANHQLYQDLFDRQWGLGQTEIDALIAAFTKKPVTVTHGYAQADFSPPQVTILLQNESQSDYLLGDYVGEGRFMQPDGTIMKAAELGSFWDASFQLLCYTENIDLTAALYEMVKASLIVGKDLLIAGGIMDPMLAGMDLAPDGRYLPDHLFARALSLRCKREFIVTDFDGALRAALKIGGIYLPNKTPYPDGGVHAAVTPITKVDIDV